MIYQASRKELMKLVATREKFELNEIEEVTSVSDGDVNDDIKKLIMLREELNNENVFFISSLRGDPRGIIMATFAREYLVVTFLEQTNIVHCYNMNGKLVNINRENQELRKRYKELTGEEWEG